MNSGFYKIEPRNDLYIKLLFILKAELKVNKEIKQGVFSLHQIYYCLRGNGTFIVNDKRIEIPPFDVLIVNQGSKITEVSKSEGFEFYTLAVSEASFDIGRKDRAVLNIKHNHINDRDMVILYYINKILEGVKYKGFKYQRVCSCLISVLAAEIQRRGDLKSTVDDPAQDSFTKRIHDFVYEGFNQEITLDSIPGKFMTSKLHLIHEFRNNYGKTPIQLLLNRRMESAMLLLKTSDKPTNDIAKLCGLDLQSYFDQAFHRVVKATPDNYGNKYKTKIKKIRK